MLEIDIHQLRQGVQPGNPVVALKHRFGTGLQHSAHFINEPSSVRGVLHDAMREDVVEMIVGKREPLTVGDDQAGAQLLMSHVLSCQPNRRVRQIDADDPRLASRKSHQIDAGAAPEIEDAAAAEPLERDQRQEVAQLVEVVVVEIAKEFG